MKTLVAVVLVTFTFPPCCFSDVPSEAAQDAEQTADAELSDDVAEDEGSLDSWSDRLDPKRVELGFRSLYFTVIPLSAGILVFMILVNRKEGKEKFSPFFGGGQFLQLVVIVMVAGNVCSLAIMGILHDNEVSAIYGGIVGYVLGRRMKAGG